MAASAADSLRGGSGKRAVPPTIPGRSAAKPTSRSGLRAIARRQPVTARLNGSIGLSWAGALGLLLVDIRPLGIRVFGSSAQRHVEGGFRQLDPEAALIELGHDRALELV